MKDLLLIAGVGFVAYHIFTQSSSAQASAVATPDSTGLLTQSSVSNPVPMPGTSTTGSSAPAATSAGTTASANPASLGSDSTAGTAAAQVNSPDAITHMTGAFERYDYVNPFNVRQIAR